MTEIGFLLELVLNHKLPKSAKEACLQRIKEVEASLVPPPKHLTRVNPVVQGSQELHPTSAPIIPARIIGGDVDNGDGTKGKRKF